MATLDRLCVLGRRRPFRASVGSCVSHSVSRFFLRPLANPNQSFETAISKADKMEDIAVGEVCYEDGAEALVEEPLSDDEVARQDIWGLRSIEEDFEKLDIEAETDGFLEFLEAQQSQLAVGTFSNEQLMTWMKVEHEKELTKQKIKSDEAKGSYEKEIWELKSKCKGLEIKHEELVTELENLNHQHKEVVAELQEKVASQQKELKRFRLVACRWHDIKNFCTNDLTRRLEVPKGVATPYSIRRQVLFFGDRPLFTYGPPADADEDRVITSK